MRRKLGPMPDYLGPALRRARAYNTHTFSTVPARDSGFAAELQERVPVREREEVAARTIAEVPLLSLRRGESGMFSAHF